MKLFGRILLAFSAVLLVAGASIHTAAFGKVSAAVATSDLAAFFGKGLKVLWLQDSTVAIVLAIVFATVAIRPSAASKAVIVLLGFVPAVTAVTSLVATFFLQQASPQSWADFCGRRRRNRKTAVPRRVRPVGGRPL